MEVQRKARALLYGCGCMHWSCWYRWRGWCKPAVAAFYLALLVVALPLLTYHLSTQHSYSKRAAWFLAGLFVLLTLPIFLFGLVQHVLNYTQPHLQKHIIRILWIVPIYSLNSFLALSVPSSAIYLDTIRECYEAYVLYNFLCYLCNFLTSEYDLIAELESRPAVRHFIPCCCLPPWPKGAVYVRRCRIGVLQYVVVRVVVTIVSLITQLTHHYTKGDIKPNNAWLYLSIINGISQAGALHSLLHFYRGTRQLLKPLHPIGKFATIKAIIFAMFWQNLLVSILVKTNVIPKSWEEYDLQEGLQNFLVVVEMVLFAIAHYFVFSHKPYIDPAAAEVPCIATCLRMLDVRDVADDVREHFVDPLPRPKFRKGRGGGISFGSSSSASEQGGKVEIGGSSEESPLLGRKAERGSVASDGDVTADHVTAVPNGSSGGGGLSDLSYTILTYGELDSRAKKYGLRSRMIANAGCREEEMRSVGEMEEGQVGDEREGSISSSQRSPVMSLSPTKERSPPPHFQ